MSEASFQVIINLPVAQAWEKLQDLSLAHHYVPGIIDTQITTPQKQGVGASRKVYQSKTSALEETVTDWREGEGFTIRLHKGAKDAPFKNAFFRYDLQEVEGGQTQLTTTMGYTPPLGAVGRGMDRLFLNKIITGVICDVALSMKLFYETGKPTQKSDLKAFKKGSSTA